MKTRIFLLSIAVVVAITGCLSIIGFAQNAQNDAQSSIAVTEIEMPREAAVAGLKVVKHEFSQQAAMQGNLLKDLAQ